MEAADVFYNREDLWQFPRQPGGDGTSMMTPYYIIMRLPGEPQAEFFLMLPMVPSRRDNMIAWLAARCDAPDYGKLIVYEFPKDKLVYGPFQIEARINQNTEISQQLTLWNQMGSRVIRGANLLVIPIENSILYVSPLYLRAEHGHLPELKRVIAAYGEHVVMKETLAEALSALFIEPGAAPAVSSTTEEMPFTGPAANQAREALDRYNQAVERLKSGDWKGFGDAVRCNARAFGENEPTLHRPLMSGICILEPLARRSRIANRDAGPGNHFAIWKNIRVRSLIPAGEPRLVRVLHSLKRASIPLIVGYAAIDTGILFTAVCWYFAWSHIGLLSEYSFFPLWVGYILLVNGLSEVIAGTSLLRRMRWSFLWLFIASIPMWWFFEYMNSFVQNWHYLFAHPISLLHYDIQASVDFSTVVPAVLSTSDLVFQLLRRRPLNTRVVIPGTALAIAFVSTFVLFWLLNLFPSETFPWF